LISSSVVTAVGAVEGAHGGCFLLVIIGL
jgi:hypothetical protein